MRFRATRALAVTAILVGGFYFFYLLPESRDAAERKELEGRLFRIERDAVDFIGLWNRHGSFELVRDGSRWVVTRPRQVQADSETVGRILDVVSAGKRVKVISPGGGGLAEFGLDAPRVKLLVGYRGTIDELLLADPNPANTHLYAYGRGRQSVFLVERQVGTVLSAGLYELRRKEAFAFDPGAVERVRITRRGGIVEFGKTAAGEWVIREPVHARGSARRIEEFIAAVATQKAEEFFDDALPDRNRYGDSLGIDLYGPSDAPLASLSVYYWGTGAREGAVTYQRGAAYYARTKREFWNYLQKEYSDFTYRNLFAFSEDELAAIAVTSEDDAFVLSTDGSRWLIDDRPADRMAVKSLLQHLQSWEAVRLERRHDREAERAGPVITIELVGRRGEKAGGLKIFGKKEAAGYAAEGLKETANFYALSDVLGGACYVNSIDIEKVTARTAFEPKRVQ